MENCWEFKKFKSYELGRKIGYNRGYESTPMRLYQLSNCDSQILQPTINGQRNQSPPALLTATVTMPQNELSRSGLMQANYLRERKKHHRQLASKAASAFNAVYDNQKSTISSFSPKEQGSCKKKMQSARHEDKP